MSIILSALDITFGIIYWTGCKTINSITNIYKYAKYGKEYVTLSKEDYDIMQEQIDNQNTIIDNQTTKIQNYNTNLKSNGEILDMMRSFRETNELMKPIDDKVSSEASSEISTEVCDSPH